MLYIVSATVALKSVINKTPKKLQTAAIGIAHSGLIERVPIQVAIEFAASVKPFIKTADSVISTVSTKGRLVVNCTKKSEKLIVPLTAFPKYNPSQ